MRRQQDTGVFRNRRQCRFGIGGQGFDFVQMGGGIGLKHRGMFWRGRAEGCFNLRHHQGPQIRVHPNMWVKLVVIIIMAAQHCRVDLRTKLDDIAIARQILEETFHLGLKVKTVPQHQIGACHSNDVRTCLAIGMRIDTRPHQPLDLNQITANFAHRIRDHSGGRHNREPLLSNSRPGHYGQNTGQNYIPKESHSAPFSFRSCL